MHQSMNNQEKLKRDMFVDNHVRKIHKKREEGLLFSWQIFIVL